MQPLHRDPWFTFRFSEGRIVDRFHLESVRSGTIIWIFAINAVSGERQAGIAQATVGEDGWVDLPQPIIMQAGEAFIAVPARCHDLTILPNSLAICRLDAKDPIPAWATKGSFYSITRTAQELSIVCLESVMPDGIRAEVGWRCFQVDGPIPFSAVGVLASLVQPLADAGISVFALSTFDTDYLLVKGTELQQAADALRRSGHVIHASPTD